MTQLSLIPHLSGRVRLFAAAAALAVAALGFAGPAQAQYWEHRPHGWEHRGPPPGWGPRPYWRHHPYVYAPPVVVAPPPPQVYYAPPPPVVYPPPGINIVIPIR